MPDGQNLYERNEVEYRAVDCQLTWPRLMNICTISSVHTSHTSITKENEKQSSDEPCVIVLSFSTIAVASSFASLANCRPAVRLV